MGAARIDPTLPADNSPIVSAELRTQFSAAQDQLDILIGKVTNMSLLNLTVSDPPTQAEVQAIADQLDELLAELQNFP